MYIQLEKLEWIYHLLVDVGEWAEDLVNLAGVKGC